MYVNLLKLLEGGRLDSTFILGRERKTGNVVVVINVKNFI